MVSLAEIETPNIRVRTVLVTDDELIVGLRDGRTIAVPLAWFPRLLNATPEQRKHWELAGAGYGIHWPDLDEDLSTEGLLRGASAPRSSDYLAGTHTMIAWRLSCKYARGPGGGLRHGFDQSLHAIYSAVFIVWVWRLRGSCPATASLFP